MPLTLGPAAWLTRKRSNDQTLSPNDLKLKRLTFDTLFAGAKYEGQWEDEWPLMLESEFDAALSTVANLTFGGQDPNGILPAKVSAPILVAPQPLQE